MILSALWPRNCDKSFDAQVLKLLGLIHLFITNTEMEFLQREHLQKKSYNSRNHIWGNLIVCIYDLFSNLKTFSAFLVTSL